MPGWLPGSAYSRGFTYETNIIVCVDGSQVSLMKHLSVLYGRLPDAQRFFAVFTSACADTGNDQPAPVARFQ